MKILLFSSTNQSNKTHNSEEWVSSTTYPHNIFLNSQRKNKVWVVIRNKVLLMSTHSICFCQEIINCQYFLVKKKSTLSGDILKLSKKYRSR